MGRLNNLRRLFLPLAKSEIVRAAQGLVRENRTLPERPASAESQCSKCGKASAVSGKSEQITFGYTSRFLDLVGQCQECRLLICGACAVKEESDKVIQFKCPKCSGLIGPRFSWEF
jgi:hypothetical protein